MNVKGIVDSGKFKVGFGMRAATVEQMKKIADDGLKNAPEKHLYFA